MLVQRASQSAREPNVMKSNARSRAKRLRDRPDSFGSLPAEDLKPRRKIVHAISDVFVVSPAIVASAVPHLSRTRRVPNHAIRRVDPDRVCVLHQDWRSFGIVREEIVLAVEDQRRRSVGIQCVDMRSRRRRSVKRILPTIGFICGII
jgi:hypothetical protein